MTIKRIANLLIIPFALTSYFINAQVSGQVLWVKADRGVNSTSGTPADNTQITTWYDQATADGSQNGSNATTHPGEAGETALPTLPFYRYTSANNFNFNPVILFSNAGTGNAVQFTNPTDANQTIFTVFRAAGNGTSYNNMLLYGGDISNPSSGVPAPARADLYLGASAGSTLSFGGGSVGDYYYGGNLGLQTQVSIGTLKRTRVSDENVSYSLYGNGSTDILNQNADPTNIRTGEGRLLSNLVRIGKHFSGPITANVVDARLNGSYAELLVYNNVLSDADRAKVESYLAIKYGITLTGGTDLLGATAGNSSYNYVNSAGTTIRVSDAAYRFDVFGLGRDDYFGLNQKISRSNNTGDILIASTNTDFTNLNLDATRTSINGDREFTLFANNKGSSDVVNTQTTELPTGIGQRLDREWKVAQFNTDGTNIANISLRFDISGFTFSGAHLNTLRLLIDSDGDGDFTTGTIQQIAPSSFTAGSFVQFNNVNITNGQVITLGTLGFACNSQMYLIQNANTALYNIQSNTNPFTYPIIGSAAGYQYNATGFNPLDGLIYGMRTFSNNLLVIGSNGVVIDLGAITGLPAATGTTNYNSGEIDNLGNYYIKPVGSNTTLYRVNLATRVANTINLTQATDPSDLAYNIVTGLLYGVGTDGRLFSINPSDGTVTFIGTSPGAAVFGAMFGSSTGEVYGINNAGGFFQFNLTNGSRAQISDAPASGNNDGAHCVTSPITFTSDLEITKTDGSATYTPGANTVYTIIAKNNGPFGVQNAIVADSVPAGIPSANVTYTAVASSGATTSVAGTMSGNINDVLSLPVNGAVTYTVTIAIPSTFTASLVNTATITAPSNIIDNNTSNNTATDTDTSICTTGVDSDGDGISDACDLDDDNDGIPDCEENGLNSTPATTFKLNNNANVPAGLLSGPNYQIQLTPNLASQSGSAMSYGKVDFSKDLAISMRAYLGNSSGGADGIAIVFHNSSAGQDAVGISGSGLGAQNIANGIALELDTYNNSAAPNSDPSYDHGTIRRTSDWSALSTTSPLKASQATAKDGSWHNVNIIWNSTTRVLSYSFDGYQVASYTFAASGTNSLATILGATTSYFGFTASTGSQFSDQRIGFDNPCSIPLFLDTDSDGIPNHLDLDSDNDGCLDAIEGSDNVTTSQLVTAGGTVTSGTGSSASNQNLCANGFCIDTNGVPTVVNSGGVADTDSLQGQRIGTSQNFAQNVCIDTDGDGIPDYIDLDDDNDGILDTAECPQAELITNGAFVNSNNWTATNWTISGGYASITNDGTATGTNLLRQTMFGLGRGTGNLNFSTFFFNGGNQQRLDVYVGTTRYASFISSAGNGNVTATTENGATINITSFSESSAMNSGWQNIQITFPYNSNVSTQELRFDSYRVGTGNGDDVGIDNVSFIISNCDSDGDGIPNALDLDSDNDGCLDAIEGDENVVFSQLVNAQSGLSVGSGSTASNSNLCANNSCVDAQGVPTIVNSGGVADIGGDQGQGIGSSQNASIDSCKDSDGDGIPDDIDLDDDNDGILDSVECGSSERVSNGVFPTTGGDIDRVPGWTVGGTYSAVWPSTTGRVTLNANGLEFRRDTTITTLSQELTGVFSYNNPIISLASVYWYKTAIGNDPLSESVLRISYAGTVYATINTTTGNTPTVTANNGATVNISTLPSVTTNDTASAKVNLNITLPSSIPSSGQLLFHFTGGPSTNRARDIGMASVSILGCKDTDGDGIPDYLDLDSDGDGCPDAFEGAASILNSQLVTAGGTLSGGSTPVNQNLCADGSCINAQGVPQFSVVPAGYNNTTGQGIGNSQNGSRNDCLDSDGDGIPDWEDVDDDNDGILDVNECSLDFSSYVVNNFATPSAVAGSTSDNTKFLQIRPSDFGLTTAGATNQNATRDYSTFFGLPAGSIIVTVENGNVHPNASVNPASDAFYVSARSGVGNTKIRVSGTLGAYVAVEHGQEYYRTQERGIQFLDGSYLTAGNLIDLGTQTTGGNWQSGIDGDYYYVRHLTNTTENTTFGYGSINAQINPKNFMITTNNTEPTEFSTYFIRIFPECDTDKDGIPNRLDLDSDADGCSDAIEGGADILRTQLVEAGGTVSGGSTPVNQNLCNAPGCVSPSGTNIGLPQLNTPPTGYSNATGQSVGASQDNTISCPSDLRITKTVNRNQISVDNVAVFTLLAENIGDATDTNVQVTDLLPSGYTYLNNNSSKGAYDAITGIWDIGDFLPGETAELIIRAYVRGTGNYNNTATIEGDTTDIDPSNNSSSASVTPIINCDPIVWYHTPDAELYTADLTTGESTLICSNFGVLGEGEYFDIGFSADGSLYGTYIDYVTSITSLRRINLSDCTATELTAVGSLLPEQANSLTFLPDGTALIGAGFYDTIYRVTITGNDYTVEDWFTIPDSDIYGSAGDFILIDNHVYAAIITSDETNRIYKILVDNAYNAVSIDDEYNNPEQFNNIFGMASHNGILYGGFVDGTIRSLDVSTTGVLDYSANLLGVAGTSIYGMTSLSEAFGTSNNCNNGFCYKPGLLTGGSILDTKVGITALSRAGENETDNWPMVRKGGWIALESKTKGFVPNRVTFTDADANPLTPDVPVGLPDTDFVEGMMVYDTTNHCLKIYTSMDSGVTFGWYCLGTQTCPD